MARSPDTPQACLDLATGTGLSDACAVTPEQQAQRRLLHAAALQAEVVALMADPSEAGSPGPSPGALLSPEALGRLTVGSDGPRAWALRREDM